MKQVKTTLITQNEKNGMARRLCAMLLSIAMAMSMISLQTLSAGAASGKAMIKLNYTSYKLIGHRASVDPKAVTSVQLKAAVLDKNLLKDANVSWKSSNTKVVKVNQYGYVNAVGDGTARVTASVKNYKAVCKITVIMHPTTNAKDAAALSKIKTQQRKRGGNVFNATVTEWTLIGKEYRITALRWQYDGARIKPLIGSISFAGLPELRTLRIYDNNLTSLDVSKNTKLTFLECDGNKLTELDLSKNKKLEHLSCARNSLKSLDISKNTALKKLNCGVNENLENLKINGATALQELSCSGTNLASLDVSGALLLKKLYCTENKNLTSLNLGTAAALQELYIEKTNLASLDVSGASSLRILRCCQNDSLTSLNASRTTALRTLTCTNNKMLASLDVSGALSLNELICNDNNLSSLNVNGTIALDRMNCSNNQLTSLDVSGETSLERLYCQNNSLTSLIVRATPVLTRIDCSGNKLQGSLDVTEAPKLSILECYDNNLESVKYVSRLLRVEGDRDIQRFLIEENPGPGYYDDDEYDDDEY